jgi:hypothetical protein
LKPGPPSGGLVQGILKGLVCLLQTRPYSNMNSKNACFEAFYGFYVHVERQACTANRDGQLAALNILMTHAAVIAVCAMSQPVPNDRATSPFHWKKNEHY